ncbi:regulator of chromosome condensation 1/beta-lactamase-inhibitor protein II [Coprinopsis sp. MPI-PUGE-AT-0042]|nr:regulator of chromosome condensation 1/beta-lactamase-inhibitor protein II [Coprinopsis sp. MPI-PUGE-AT-0042]
MFKRATVNALRSTRQIHTTGFHHVSANRKPVLLVSAALIGATVSYATGSEIHNDAAVTVGKQGRDSSLADGSLVKEHGTLHSLVWGSNRAKILSHASPTDESIRSPSVARWLDGIALRDLQLHERHAACVDAKGDVYQWGEGYLGDLQWEGDSHSPKLTLKGKNIVQLQLTEDKVFALSASGHIYVFASRASKQALAPGTPTPSSDSWWGTGWLWGEEETIDFVKLQSHEKLHRNEKFTQIAAGQNHLLARTTKGRAFAHPINKKANQNGQLGFRKVTVPDPTPHLTGHKDASLTVELVPKSLADPFAKASRSARLVTASPGSTTDDLVRVDDASIRFCPFIYELPVLREVEVAQVAAGARSSFARTPTGRVLAWGANEYGQLGLGGNVTLDTIIVPTEVVLWRATRGNVITTCTDVSAGGDLTGFIVDRATDKTDTELLMTGNGQYGGLGNNTFSNGQSNPTRVKALSGLQQYNDLTQRMDPIKPDDIAISQTGHVLLALNTSPDSTTVGGSDLYAWGRNFDSELGNSKRSSSSTPLLTEVPVGERLMLMRQKAGEVKDLHGKVWKRGVDVEQRVAAGFGNSVVYWKIADKQGLFGKQRPGVKA